MPIRSRSNSIGFVASKNSAEMDWDNSTGENYDSFSAASHLDNLRSLSRGKLLKSSMASQKKPGEFDANRNHPLSSLQRNNSHDSIELLSARNLNSSVQRRQTLAGVPRLPTLVEEEGATRDFPTSHASLPSEETKPIQSPEIVGGLQYNTSSLYKTPRKSRNSIDNANISNLMTSRKIAPDAMKGDALEGRQERIKVYVRLRPMSNKEKAAGARCCVKEANRREIFLTEMASESDYLRLKRLKGRYFVFDGAFPGDASQDEVYCYSTAQLVEGVLEGHNSSVFCYGATGAGKTFTMLGTQQEPGVMVLAIRDLFSKLEQRSADLKQSVCLSYLEVYNETVRDLLSPGRALVVREDVKQGVVVAGITSHKVFSEDEVMALLQQGNLNRTTEPTRLNETSSRSHAILQVTVQHNTYVSSQLVTRIGKLSLIDLAGSERSIATDQRTLRSLEGANINRSLLALSSCISALVEGKRHIPFRNSKLTQLLKDSLGGVCLTAMIANVSPSNLSFGETQNTLYWADRAKEIRMKGPVANEELLLSGSGHDQLQLVLELQKENQLLRTEVAQLKQQVLSLQSKATVVSTGAVEDGSLNMLPNSSVSLIKRMVHKESKVEPASGVSPPERRPACPMDVPVDADFAESPHPLNQNFCPDNSTTDRQTHKKAVDRFARTPLTVSSIKRKVITKSPVSRCPNPASRFHSSVQDQLCRKRTFWDITNSPSVKSVSRNIRSNSLNETTPSMLLQPGFLRGRPSLN